ncbi:MAG TPA: hypothetical protein PLT08_13050 [Anaerolineales bacterium]|nr:hypothetical protein [Anaerolineales bacterium]
MQKLDADFLVSSSYKY